MDYGALPPEVNSGRMHAGPGSAPMMAAAGAWRGLAAELAWAASSYDTAVSQLTGEAWLGPAAASMTAASAPYEAWMHTTAGEAEQAAVQATAAASAFDAAFAATVPPPVVAANRAQLAALVATNVLGQNTPAIAVTEAHYGEMWSQDAAAMYGYAGSSATAAQLTPFTSPEQTTNPAGAADQAAAVTQAAGTAAGNSAQTAQLMSALPGGLQALSSPMASMSSPSPGLSGLTGLVNALGESGSGAGMPVNATDVLTPAATAAAFIPSTLLPNLLGYTLGAGGNAAVTPASGLGSLLAPGGALGNLGALGGGAAGNMSSASAPAVSGSMGRATMVGALSAPPSWAAATPAGAGTAATGGSGWAAAPENNSLTTMPGGMPHGAGGGRGGGLGFGAPRYGFKPTVMPRTVIA